MLCSPPLFPSCHLLQGWFHLPSTWNLIHLYFGALPSLLFPGLLSQQCFQWAGGWGGLGVFLYLPIKFFLLCCWKETRDFLTTLNLKTWENLVFWVPGFWPKGLREGIVLVWGRCCFGIPVPENLSQILDIFQEENKATSHQGPAVGLEGSSRWVESFFGLFFFQGTGILCFFFSSLWSCTIPVFPDGSLVPSWSSFSTSWVFSTTLNLSKINPKWNLRLNPWISGWRGKFQPHPPSLVSRVWLLRCTFLHKFGEVLVGTTTLPNPGERLFFLSRSWQR